MPTKKLKEITLQNQAAATSNGVWYDITAWERVSVQVSGTFVGTAQIFGWCGPTKLSDATDGVKLGSDISTPTIYEVHAKIKWVKVKISAYTSGNIDAFAVGDETKYGY